MFFGWNKHRKALRKHKYANSTKTSKRKSKKFRGKYTHGTKVYRLLNRPKNIEYVAAPSAYNISSSGSYLWSS